MSEEELIGHIRPRAGKRKQCEAWVDLFRKFEGVEFEEVEWDAYGKTAYKIKTKPDDALDDKEKSRVFAAYDDGNIEEETARKIIGNPWFQTAKENTEGAKKMMEGNTGRFVE